MKDALKLVLFFLLVTICMYVITTCTSCAHAQQGFNQNSTQIRQCTLPVAVVMDSSIPEEFRPAVRNAMKYWNDFSGKELFMSLGVMSSETITKHPKWFMVIETLPAEKWPHPVSNSCGTIEFFFRTDTNCITSGKISLLERCMQHRNQTEALESVVRHELGHLLGLPEAPEGSQTVMCPRSWFGQLPAVANEKDLELLNKLYSE